jgi:hypothetical protein
MDDYEPEINMRMSYKLQIFPNKKPLRRGFWKGVVPLGLPDTRSSIGINFSPEKFCA